MTTTLNIAEQLAAITGPQYVHQREDGITASPANTQQVSAILRYANENGLTVTPTGGNTKQCWGNPTQTNIRLSLTRLNRVLEHPWQDLTCTVQSGCTWQHLQQALAKHGQFVALDPLWPERATVGGILATNDSGAIRHRYGSLRDLVIGMTLVLADGTIARTGGKVVKNVAGYDLSKLLTGSFGTLAVITEATFRLHPLPQHAQTFTVSAPQAAQLAPLMAAIQASHLLTQALQLRGTAEGFHLDIQLNAHPEARQNEILEQMTEAADLKLDQGQNEIWQAREDLFSKEGGVAKATMIPSAVVSLADDVRQFGGHSVAQALGIMYVNFPNYKTEQPFNALRAHIDAIDGSLSILNDSEFYGDEVAPPWDKEITTPLMQAIKHQFDPNRTLNPGRFSEEFKPPALDKCHPQTTP